MYMFRANGIVNRCSFNDNRAANFGGAVYVDQSTLTITNSGFGNNEARRGGAIAEFRDSFVDADNCDFVSNVAEYGGAIYQSTFDTLPSDSEYTNILYSGNNATMYCDNFFPCDEYPYYGQ